MISEINTKELLKLFNPQKDQILLNEDSFSLDIKTLETLVNNPTAKIFESSESPKTNFYNKLALHVINFEDNKYIDINLEKNTPHEIIENGLVHLAAVQYLKKPTLFVNIKENTIGENFIKTKKLLPTEKNITPYQESIMIEQVNFENEIVVDNFFTWKNGDSDKEKDIDFYMKSLINHLNSFNKKDNKERQQGLSDLANLYKQIPNNIKNDSRFQNEIFETHDLCLLFFELYNDGNKLIDFASDEIKERILNQIEAKDFRWVKTFYSENRSYNNKNLSDRIAYINELYNHPKVIQALTDGTIKTYSSWSSNEFNLKNIFKYLKHEHQTDKKVIFSYLESCEAEHRGNDKWITDSDLYKIPLEMFKDMDVLKRAAYTIDWENFKSYFNRFDIEPPKLDNNFLLSVAKDLQPWRFRGLVEKFYKKTSFDDDFKKECLRKNPRLYENEIFNDMFKKISNLIFLTEELQFKYDKIDFKFIKPYLFDKSLSEKEKEFLNIYMIETKKNLSRPDDLGIPKELHDEFKETYQKPEYSFYQIDTWSAWRDDSIKKLKKIKSPDELIQIFENSTKYKYPIDVKPFFNGINPTLKSNSKVIFNFLNMVSSDIDLNECGNFLFNKQNCIKLLDYNPKLRKFIPEQMYYDKELAIALAEKLDVSPNFENIPVKVKKFFEQKEINQNYHSFLKSFISYNELINNKNLVKNNEQPIKKKNKI